MIRQPLDDLLTVASHRCRRRIRDVLKDRLEQRASAVHQPLDVLRALPVDIGEEEQLLVTLDHETREVHVTKVVLHPRKVGISGGSSSLSALALADL